MSDLMVDEERYVGLSIEQLLNIVQSGAPEEVTAARQAIQRRDTGLMDTASRAAAAAIMARNMSHGLGPLAREL